MTPRIETINEKKLAGKRMKLSYADYRIAELWSGFMPKRKEIKNCLSAELISNDPSSEEEVWIPIKPKAV